MSDADLSNPVPPGSERGSDIQTRAVPSDELSRMKVRRSLSVGLVAQGGSEVGGAGCTLRQVNTMLFGEGVRDRVPCATGTPG